MAVVVEGRLGIGGGEGDSSVIVGRRGGAIRGGGNGTGRDDRPVIRAGRTKYKLNTIEGHSIVPL